MTNHEDADSLIDALKGTDGKLRLFLEGWDGSSGGLTDFLNVWYNGLISLAISTFTDMQPLGMIFARKGHVVDASRMSLMKLTPPKLDGSRAHYTAMLNNGTALISDIQYLFSFINLTFSDGEMPPQVKMVLLNCRKGIENLLLSLMMHYTESGLRSLGSFSVPAITA
jgi:hypothetical protein